MAVGTEAYSFDWPGVVISILIVCSMIAPFFMKLWRNSKPEEAAKPVPLPVAAPQAWWQKVVNNDPGHAPEPEQVDLIPGAHKPAPGYHLTDIERGELGELSKVREELYELLDAHIQKSRIMVSIELADTVGAFQAFLDRHLPGNDVAHLARISDSSAFVPSDWVSIMYLCHVLSHLENTMRLDGPDAQLRAAVNFLGGVESFSEKHVGMTMNDLVIFANITKRAFENGHRSPKPGAA